MPADHAGHHDAALPVSGWRLRQRGCFTASERQAHEMTGTDANQSISQAAWLASNKKTLTVNILGFFHHFPPFMQDAVFPFTSKAGHFDCN